MNYLRTAILLAGLTALFMGVGYLIGGAGGATIALVIAAATNLFAYWNSDRMVLSMYGAHEVDARTAPELVSMVAALAARAGLPMPRVFLMDNPQPNAFATGRNPQNAAVAVTTGLVQSLSREELSGVIAHELAHVKNHDTLLMTITATIAGAISMVAQFGMFFGQSRRSHRRPADVAGVRASQDRGRRARDSEHGGRTQSGDGSHVHHQSAVRSRYRQSVFDAPVDREPDRRAAAACCRAWVPAGCCALGAGGIVASTWSLGCRWQSRGVARSLGLSGGLKDNRHARA
jgi:hypothetical protein